MMMMPCVLGIDVGSSSAKVGLFDLAGTTLAISTHSYPTFQPRAGFKEQDPERWWQAVIQGIRAVRRKVPRREILAVGATGHISSLTFVDASGKVLRPAISFQDLRAADQLETLYARFSRQELAQLLGIDLPPAANWPLPRLLWFRKHEPAILDAAHRVLQAKDFVNFRFTGEMVSDCSSNRGMVDFATEKVAASVFSAFDLPARLVPRISPPHQIIGGISSAAARQTGLPEGLPVVTGWNDFNAGVLGSGTVHEGDSLNVTGTSDHLGVITTKSYSVPELIWAPFLGEKHLLYGVTSSGGGSLAWVSELFQRKADELLRSAETVPAGADSLLFLPYLEGERSPIWDPRASGTFIGIHTLHGLRHFARAVLEGVAYSLRQILELVTGLEPAVKQRLVVSGGAARADLWNQIKADVFGRPLVTLANPHVGVMGTAILAAVGTGHYVSYEEAVKEMVHTGREYLPQPSHAERYRECYSNYCRLYPALRAWFAETHQQRIITEDHRA
ncbi:MAG TPA: FGGY family carbohydrate kinase [Terriglobia bacterium]|nr:FGGY family carbohydrate kinase [Terriglobia bacterium]